MEPVYVVRGSHAFIDVWDLYLEDDFKTKHQRDNLHDKYVIAILPVDTKEVEVGHLPKEISRVCCLFIYHGGSIISIVKSQGCKMLFINYSASIIYALPKINSSAQGLLQLEQKKYVML